MKVYDRWIETNILLYTMPMYKAVMAQFCQIVNMQKCQTDVLLKVLEL